MRILVTGSEGFIGSHLTRELERSGYEVRGVDRHHGGDLSRPHAAEFYLDAYEPDICIHLAAKVGRVNGEEGLRETAAVNAGLTAEIAKVCGEMGVRLVYASTSEVYGDVGTRTCYEDAKRPLLLPHNLYGLSKRWGEEACQLYAPEGLTIWRISMPYGPRQPCKTPGRHAALSSFLRCALDRREIPVHRGAERSWCYIDDTARAMRLTLERTDGGIFNIGRDDDRRPMLEIAQLACRLVGAPTSLVKEVEPPNQQTLVKRLSTAKLRSLGWSPRISLEEGMQRTAIAMGASLVV